MMIDKCYLRLVLVAFVASRGGLAAGPFELQLSGLSEVWFPSASVIRVPSDRCNRIDVRLQSPWSRQVRQESIAVHLDGFYRPFWSLVDGDVFLFRAETREPRGLLTKEEHRVEASSSDSNAIKGEWTINRWNDAYIQAVAAGRVGSPIKIVLKTPLGGVITAGRGAIKVRCQGDLPGAAADARLAIAGQTVPRLPGKPGYQFDHETSIPEGGRELAITAHDGGGNSTTLVLFVAK